MIYEFWRTCENVSVRGGHEESYSISLWFFCWDPNKWCVYFVDCNKPFAWLGSSSCDEKSSAYCEISNAQLRRSFELVMPILRIPNAQFSISKASVEFLIPDWENQCLHEHISVPNGKYAHLRIPNARWGYSMPSVIFLMQCEKSKCQSEYYWCQQCNR